MEPNINKNKTNSRKSNGVLGMTGSQITILSIMGGFVLILFGVLVGLILSNTNSLPSNQSVAPISYLTSSPPTAASEQPTMVAPISYLTSSPPTVASEQPTTVADNYVVGTWLDTWVGKCTVTIKKINGSYQMTRLYSDGSGETKFLTVQMIRGIERLIEYSDSPAGDYMVILENGNLAFYDNKGLIYEDYPK